jgi:hypothetical protein
MNLSLYSRVPSLAPLAKLRAETYRVLIGLGRFADDEGRCWPGLSSLAKASGVIRHNLHRNLRDLVAAGLLRINSDGTYTLIFEPERVSPEPERVSPEPERVSPEPERVSPEPERVSPEPLSIEEQPNEHTRAREQVLFERFWQVYPSRGTFAANPKKPASQVFAGLVRRGVDPEMMIAAAERYCESVAALDDRRYVAQALTWLRQGRYADGAEIRQNPAASSEGASQTKPIRPDIDWRPLLTAYKAAGCLGAAWPKPATIYGLRPESRASRVPVELLAEFGLTRG